VSAGAAPASIAPQSAELLAAVTLGAYARCFGLMSVTAIVILPGVFLFRAVQQGPARGEAV
jgi:hypothetical protein